MLNKVDVAKKVMNVAGKTYKLGDTITYPGPPVRSSEHYWFIRRRAPLIGEHNEEIYGRELGLSSEQLAAMQDSGVI